MKSLLVASFAVGLVALAVVPANAQLPRPERPYRGLFGGGTGNWEQSLVANGSLGWGWTDNVVAEALGRRTGRPGDLDRNHRGGSGQASGALAYSLSRNRVAISASASTTASYYPSITDEIFRREYASVAARARLAEGLSASTFAGYAPFSFRSMFLTALEPDIDETEAPDVELASSSEHSLTYGGGITYDRPLSRRLSFGANYGYRVRETTLNLGRFTRHGAGAQLSYAIGAGFNARVGYQYSEAHYSERDLRRANHVINAGIDYSRTLSFSRRTTLGFSTGTTATTRPEADDTRIRYRMSGSVRLNHEMGRTWNAWIAYSRRVRLDETWSDPVFSDAVSAGFGGLITRRLQFQSSARTATGQVGFGRDGGFNGYSANATLGFALSRYASLGVAYSYYYHRLGRAVLPPPGFPSGVERNAVRAYVSAWVPVFHRTRRADVTR